MSRQNTFQSFVTRFHEGDAPVAVPLTEIQRIECELKTLLPEAYCMFMDAFGPVHTPSLLPLIVEGDHDIEDVLVIFEPKEVIDGTTAYWAVGMPSELIGFASDNSGNLFCFRRRESGGSRADDSEVWFFDHDYSDQRKVAGGFEEWLARYLSLEQNP
jgi:hypothetical protein